MMTTNSKKHEQMNLKVSSAFQLLTHQKKSCSKLDTIQHLEYTNSNEGGEYLLEMPLKKTIHAMEMAHSIMEFGKEVCFKNSFVLLLVLICSFCSFGALLNNSRSSWASINTKSQIILKANISIMKIIYGPFVCYT